MPAPSTWAKRLADDLVEVGQTFGFIAVKEEPPVSSSAMKIDVVWKIQFDKEIEKIIPHETVIVSIEIIKIFLKFLMGYGSTQTP